MSFNNPLPDWHITNPTFTPWEESEDEDNNDDND